jgi:DNA-binding response OmpR family regulator
MELELSADDNLTKPFSQRERLARISANLRIPQAFTRLPGNGLRR